MREFEVDQFIKRAKDVETSSPEYFAWRAMVRRCTDKRHPKFADYGARGVTVADEWKNDFAAFKSALGPRPSDQHSIERLDNSKGYAPGNVRWATAEDQANNRRDNRVLTLKGKAKSVAEWANERGTDPKRIHARLARGDSPKEAVTRPVEAKFRNKKAAPKFEDPNSESARRYQEYRGRRGTEMKLFSQWQESGKKPEHLEPLLASINPLIKSEASKRMQGLGGSIPRAAVENELRISAVKSLNNYDPSQSALSTHITGGFRRISDFVNANRNARYVPGEDMKRFDQYRNASAELRYEHGRDPTAQELATHTGWSPKVVKKMQRSFGKELYTDLGDEVSTNESGSAVGPRDAFFLVHSQLTPQEREFGNMYFPPEGQKQPAIANIAKALGVPTHRAYRLKAKVETRVGRVLKNE